MENENYNAKCSKCGYIYEADENSEQCECPLCKNIDDRKKSNELFKETFKDYFPKKLSKPKLLINTLLFGVSFIVFILLLYFVITLIINLTSG